MNRTLAIAALTVTAALAGCAASHSAAHEASSHPSPAARHLTARAATTTTAVPGVTLAAGQHLPPGPFRITPVYCGMLSAAQRTTYGTNAAGGLIYKFTNVSNTLTAAASVSADFTDGTTVNGNNVAGAADLSPIGPGQSATGEVDAVGSGGQNLKFTGCEVMNYGVITNSGAQPESFAP